MSNTEPKKPGTMLVPLSPKAKAAILKEQGRRMQAGEKPRLVDVAASIIEDWAETAA